MLTNMESQLKEQGAEERFDEVLLEIPRVREDLGFIPLVTPTSQIVGTQAVLNVLTGERYKSITKETAGVLKGEYGATAAPVNKALQDRVLEGGKAITCRPADVIEPELVKLEEELDALTDQKSLRIAKNKIDDVLTYALFPQVGLKFIENRDNPSAFEPSPSQTASIVEATDAAPLAGDAAAYQVRVEGQIYHVEVAQSGEISHMSSASSTSQLPSVVSESIGADTDIPAPLSGNIISIAVAQGEQIYEGDVILILEAMKMETEVRSAVSGVVKQINVKDGDAVQAGQTMMVVG
jgi:oxaloacetate decarboxylase alpha subunit